MLRKAQEVYQITQIFNKIVVVLMLYTWYLSKTQASTQGIPAIALECLMFTSRASYQAGPHGNGNPMGCDSGLEICPMSYR